MYFILTMIEALLRTNAKMYVLDLKNAELADPSVVMPRVYYRKEGNHRLYPPFLWRALMERSEIIKQLEGYKTGKTMLI